MLIDDAHRPGRGTKIVADVELDSGMEDTHLLFPWVCVP